MDCAYCDEPIEENAACAHLDCGADVHTKCLVVRVQSAGQAFANPMCPHCDTAMQQDALPGGALHNQKSVAEISEELHNLESQNPQFKREMKALKAIRKQKNAAAREAHKLQVSEKRQLLEDCQVERDQIKMKKEEALHKITGDDSYKAQRSASALMGKKLKQMITQFNLNENDIGRWSANVLAAGGKEFRQMKWRIHPRI